MDPKPMTFEEWRETEEGWAADDGDTDNLVQAYQNYVADFEG